MRSILPARGRWRFTSSSFPGAGLAVACSLSVENEVAPPAIDWLCPACHESASETLGTKNGHSFRHCTGCATISLQTLPSRELLDEFYADYYDHGNFAVHPQVARTLDVLARSFASYRATNRWLDVGYGTGGLLATAERHGWSCHGVELSPAALRYGSRCGWTVSSRLDDGRFPAAGFDVVTMIELIEHVAAPDDCFRAAACLLRPGGALYLTTPNARSLNAQILQLDWSIFAPPEHLTIWSAKGLCCALLRAGFSSPLVQSVGLNPCELRMRLRPPRPGECPPDRNQTALALNQALERTPLRRGLKAAINGVLSLMDAGDRLKAQAIKCAGVDRP
jgi:SAM-dependent methyltransferase